MHSVYIRVEFVWLCDEETGIMVEFVQENNALKLEPLSVKTQIIVWFVFF